MKLQNKNFWRVMCALFTTAPLATGEALHIKPTESLSTLRDKLANGLDEWHQFSGLDRDTIFADPLYPDTAGRDFRLEPNSPNRRAGGDGATIGALED